MLGWLGTLIEAAIENEPPQELMEWCQPHYSPYYGLMHLLAKELQAEGCCVELGVEKGRASYALSMSGREVHGFDHTRRDAEIHALSVKFKNFHFHERPSLPPPPDWKEPIAILHVDTEHSYAMAREEFMAWKQHLVHGSVVLFDDTHAMDSAVGHFISTLTYPTIFDNRLHSCGYAVMLYR